MYGASTISAVHAQFVSQLNKLFLSTASCLKNVEVRLVVLQQKGAIEAMKT